MLRLTNGLFVQNCSNDDFFKSYNSKKRIIIMSFKELKIEVKTLTTLFALILVSLLIMVYVRRGIVNTKSNNSQDGPLFNRPIQ